MGLTFTRRFLFVWFAAAPTLGWAACTPPRVLFVCPAGTVKSAIAREALRARVKAERFDVAVTSRGLTPEDHVSPTLAARLRRDGLDPARESATALTARDVAAADVVVAFDDAASAPELREARAWRTPSWNNDYDAAKADLAARLDGLMLELRRRAEGCQ